MLISIEWFRWDWLSSNLKALGIYMALLYTRFNHFDKADVSKEMGWVLEGEELDEVRDERRV